MRAKDKLGMRLYVYGPHAFETTDDDDDEVD